MSKSGQRLTNKEEAALFGLALQDKDVWKAVRRVGSEFNFAPLNEVYKLALELEQRLNRSPNRTELEEAVRTKYGGEAAGHLTTIRQSVDEATKIGADTLKLRLSDWARTKELKKRSESIQQKFNEGDLDATVKEWRAGAAELEAIDATIQAGTDTMQVSPDRMEAEAEARAQDEGKHLEYGITFLDDDLGGLMRRQLVMVGADTGVGKTEFARLVSLHNAARGARVHGFFLEADEDEIERRTKFPLLLKAYSEDKPNPDPRIFNYVNWMHNKCKALDKYNDKVEKEYRAKYPNFKTYYRNRIGFGASDLKRAMLAARSEADLFVVDHLQYVDLDSDKHEVSETTQLVMSMREAILTTGIPVLCISHLKKSGRSTGILACLDDFHGSSNITKIATTCIVLAPLNKEANIIFDGSPKGLPTLVQAVKYRLDGERAKYTGICHYHPTEAEYDERYGLGALDFGRNKWKSLDIGQVPPWWPNPQRILMQSDGGMDNDDKAQERS